MESGHTISIIYVYLVSLIILITAYFFIPYFNLLNVISYLSKEIYDLILLTSN